MLKDSFIKSVWRGIFLNKGVILECFSDSCKEMSS